MKEHFLGALNGESKGRGHEKFFVNRSENQAGSASAGCVEAAKYKMLSF